MPVVGVREDEQKAGGVANLFVSNTGAIGAAGVAPSLVCGGPGKGAMPRRTRDTTSSKRTR